MRKHFSVYRELGRYLTLNVFYHLSIACCSVMHRRYFCYCGRHRDCRWWFNPLRVIPLLSGGQENLKSYSTISPGRCNAASSVRFLLRLSWDDSKILVTHDHGFAWPCRNMKCKDGGRYLTLGNDARRFFGLLFLCGKLIH